jgi:hypothetical protein
VNAQQPAVLTAKGQGTTVTFDGATVTITRGVMAPGGKGEAAFPLRLLTGVDLVMPGLTAMAGRFSLIGAGGSAQRHTKRDPMSVTFTYTHRREFEALANAVREALTQVQGQAYAQPSFAQQAPAAAPTPSAGQGLDAQLANLAALRASGALTEQEFAAAKAHLLGGAAGPQNSAPQQW